MVITDDKSPKKWTCSFNNTDWNVCRKNGETQIEISENPRETKVKATVIRDVKTML
jgi:hypothetical protein